MIHRKVERQLCETINPCLIRQNDTTDIGGHIGKYKVDGFASQGRFKLGQCRIFAKVALNEGHTIHALHFKQVNTNDSSLPFHAADGHLTPAAGGTAQIDHHLARFEQMVTIINFHQLKSCTRAPALRVGLLHVKIINVTLMPLVGFGLSFHGLLSAPFPGFFIYEPEHAATNSRTT